MLLRKYLKDEFKMDVTTYDGKLSFLKNLLKQCDYTYSGTCEDYGIDAKSEQGQEYAAAYGSPCIYVSAQATETGSFEYENEIFKVMGISQRLAGRFKRSNKNDEGADLNVLFDAEMIIEEWEDEDGSHRALKLRCLAKQQPFDCFKVKL